MHEEQALSFPASRLWTALQENVENTASLLNFKKNLKSHLIQKCYNKLSYHTSTNEKFIANHYYYLLTEFELNEIPVALCDPVTNVVSLVFHMIRVSIVRAIGFEVA